MAMLKKKAVGSELVNSLAANRVGKDSRGGEIGAFVGEGGSETKNCRTGGLSTTSPEPDIIFALPKTVVGSSYDRTCMEPHWDWPEVQSFHKYGVQGN